MKGRESGMPVEAYWTSFFDAQGVLACLAFPPAPSCNVVEFGCGYGTFTFPAAARTAGVVTALDIEPELIGLVRARAEARGHANIRAVLRDFVDQGSGLAPCSQDYALIFNLLHLENPVVLLREAWRTLKPGGVLAVIHWRSDIDTPRGPPLAIRPTPSQCRTWMAQAGFTAIESIGLAAAAPYHFGMVARRSAP